MQIVSKISFGGQCRSSKFCGDRILTCLVLACRENLTNCNETCVHVRAQHAREIAGGVVEIDWMVGELSCDEVGELRAVVFFVL